jgi:hypothetical protein
MAEYDRSATGPLPVDAGPRRAESIFDLSPEDFRASLGEMQAMGHDTDALMRQYRARNSPFAPINNAAAAQQQGLADSGRRSVLGGLLSKPEGATGLDAITGLEREGWRGLLGAGQQVGQAFDAPAAAYQGLIPESDRIAEAVNVAGVTMGSGGLATAPRGALRSGLAREVAESPAQGVARLLREGRASEVTYDVLARLSPNDNAELFRLYDDAETGMDLPMDDFSRLARADAGGFERGLLYHGSDNPNITAFDPSKGAEGLPATFLTDSRRVAETYGNNVGEYLARADYPAEFYFDGRSTTNFHNQSLTPGGLVRSVRDAADDAKTYGSETDTDLAFDLQSAGIDPMDADAIDSVRMRSVVDDFGFGGDPANNLAVFDPSNIRSRAARFDPRLSSNANLLAANASQSGGLLGAGLSEAQRQARDILDMRAAGNARSVTDDMMGRADDQYMFDNTPLPMDEASRLARADAGGFGGDLYHGDGGGSNARAFHRPNQPAYFAYDPNDAGDYASYVTNPDPDAGRMFGDDAQIQAVKARAQNIAEADDVSSAYEEVSGMERDYLDGESWVPLHPDLSDYSSQVADELQRRRFDSVFFDDDSTPINGEYIDSLAVLNPPTNIRSRFARFDPEFSHLSNLSAANASPTAGLLASGAQEQDKPLPFMEMLRGLLR